MKSYGNGICILCKKGYKKGDSIRFEKGHKVHDYQCISITQKPKRWKRIERDRTPNHYIYKITNKTTKEFYIGRHFPKIGEPLREYMGSGTKIQAAILEEGEDNFHKEILISGLTGPQAELEEAKLIVESLANHIYFNGPKLYNDPSAFGQLSAKIQQESGYIDLLSGKWRRT